MSDLRHWRDQLLQWNGTQSYTYENLRLAALMSIRDELQKLNRVFACPNVQKGFAALQRISRQNDIAFKRRVEAAARKRIARRKP